jgi:hypothetical protein
LFVGRHSRITFFFGQSKTKIVINNKIIEQVTEFIYLGSHLSQFNNQKDIDRNLIKYNRLNETPKINLGKQIRK